MTLVLGHPVVPVKLGMGVQKQSMGKSKKKKKSFSNSLGMDKDVGSKGLGICLGENQQSSMITGQN